LDGTFSSMVHENWVLHFFSRVPVSLINRVDSAYFDEYFSCSAELDDIVVLGSDSNAVQRRAQLLCVIGILLMTAAT